MKFSILIPTLPSRIKTFFPRLLDILEPQVKDKPVEILALLDNKTMSLGDKRNQLMKLAQGDFLAFIDDDDVVEANYVDTILAAITANPHTDCIVFPQLVYINNGPPKRCLYGIEYEYEDGPELWTGKPAHTQVWNSRLAKSCSFSPKLYGEDFDFVAQAWPKVKRQVRLDCAPLYNYYFNTATSETRKRRCTR